MFLKTRNLRIKNHLCLFFERPLVLAFSKQITFTPFYFKRIDLLFIKMKLTQALRYWGSGEGGRFGNNGPIQVIIRFISRGIAEN